MKKLFVPEDTEQTIERLLSNQFETPEAIQLARVYLASIVADRKGPTILHAGNSKYKIPNEEYMDFIEEELGVIELEQKDHHRWAVAENLLGTYTKQGLTYLNTDKSNIQLIPNEELIEACKKIYQTKRQELKKILK